jgi:predicted outer membrane protein
MSRKLFVRQILGASLLAAGACSHYRQMRAASAKPAPAKPSTQASSKAPAKAGAQAPAQSTAQAPAQTTAQPSAQSAAQPATPNAASPSAQNIVQPTQVTTLAAAKAPDKAPAKAPAKPSKAPPKAKAPAAPRVVNAPNDANITAIVLAEDNTDLSYVRLVRSRAQSDAVKEYATQMATEHNGVNRQVNDLLVRINLNPEDNKTSLAFRDTSAAHRDQLRTLQGHAFDTTFMANEVTYHRKYLAALDSSLMRSARNSELKKLLTSLRPAVAARLERAEQVRSGLSQ